MNNDDSPAELEKRGSERSVSNSNDERRMAGNGTPPPEGATPASVEPEPDSSSIAPSELSPPVDEWWLEAVRRLNDPNVKLPIVP